MRTAEERLWAREEENEHARGRGETRSLVEVEKTIIIAAEAIIEALYKTRR